MTTTASKTYKPKELNDLKRVMTTQYDAIIVHRDQNIFARIAECLEKTK